MVRRGRLFAGVAIFPLACEVWRVELKFFDEQTGQYEN